MKRIITILGTRPEIIRLSRVIEKLDRLCEHRLVHTGQNADPNLSDIFFRELRVRQPDFYLGVKSDNFGQQVAQILNLTDKVLSREKPNAVLILGDTNSGLTSILAKRAGIPVYHMEAGNRCYDDRVPEEVNRSVIDHSSTVLMPYTERSKENLLREGIDESKIYVTGNPIYEVLSYYKRDISVSGIHKRLGVDKKKYFLVTMHRAENVDVESRLRKLVTALGRVQKKYNYPVICSLHPHTKQRMQRWGLKSRNSKVRFLAPLGFFDFVALEQSAFCVLTDSGTVQEECCIFHVPNIILRDVTERPETIDCGSGILSGCEPEVIIQCVKDVLSQEPLWQPPAEYLEPNVSEKVANIILRDI